MDAGPQQALRSFNPFDRMPNAMLQIINGERCCISELLLGIRPDIFIGIDFRGIGGKSVSMKSAMLAQEYAHRAPAMNRSAIPHQVNRTPNLSQQLTQEHNHFLSGDIAAMELSIQGQVVATGRDCDARNNREPIPPVAMSQNRSLANRCPRSPDSGNKQKAAFVKECQVCAPFPGVFLYAARRNASNRRWRPRRVAWRVVLAFERSTATRWPRVARWLTGNSAHQRFSPRWRQFVAGSTVRWDILPPARHALVGRQGEQAGACLDGKADRVWVAPLNRGARTVDSFDTSERRSSTRLRVVRIRRDTCNHVVAEQWHSAAVALMLQDFHVVSWKEL